MPILLHRALLDANGPALTCSLVAFHPADGEQMFFSWSPRTTRGPGISRTGIGPPFMRTAWSPDDPWGTTDDAELMRNMSGYIDEDCLKLDELLSMEPESVRSLTTDQLVGLGVDHLLRPGDMPCGKEPGAELREAYRRRAFDARRADEVHTSRFSKRYPGKRLVGQVGCGDTTMNLWHVACVQDANDSLTFLYLEDEPIYDRTYPCLVGWRTGLIVRSPSKKG